MTTRAALYHRVSAADRGATVDEGLGRLRGHAAAQGWQVVAEISDHRERHDTVRPGWRELVALVDAGGAGAVVAVSLHRLFPRLDDLVEVWGRWAAAGVAVVSLEDAFDATRPEDRLPALRMLALLAEYRRARHAEATRVGTIARALAASGQVLEGRPVVAVNDLELRQLYEGGDSWREMVRKIRRRGGRMSMGLLAQNLKRLREEGKLDEAARAAAVARRPPRKGGRPRRAEGAATKRARR